jgi:VWFA-related protein
LRIWELGVFVYHLDASLDPARLGERVRRLLVLAAFLCTAVSIGTAQIPSSSAQAPVFRTDAGLVRVSVIVKDDRGRPIPGLTAADFELFDQGQPQRVLLFSVEGSASPSRAAADDDVFTNRIDGPASAGVTVLLFDRLNTLQEHQSIARNHIFQYLKQLRPEDRVGFYVLEADEVLVLHDFTRDAASLIKAVERVDARTSVPLAGSQDQLVRGIEVGLRDFNTEIEGWVARAEEHIQGFFIDRRVKATTGAMEALAAHLAGVRGRKNVIWISSGFPILFNDGIMTRNASPELFRATRALNDADIAFYPVDARGLMGVFSTPPGARQQEFSTLDDLMSNIETSQVIAEKTGGHAYFNTNDLGGAIQRAAEDSRLTYVLGYTPSHAQWDGRFREIKVRVRRRDVSVRHRSGYFAVRPEVPSAVDKQNAVLAALDSPLDATGVGVSVSVAKAAAAGDVALTIRVEPAAVLLKPEGGMWTGELDVAIAHTLPDGRLVRMIDATVPLRLSESAREQLLAEGLTFTRTLTLRPDADQVKVAIRNSAGAIGTVTIPASRLRGAVKPSLQ